MGWKTPAPQQDPNIALAEKEQADLAAQQENFYEQNVAPQLISQLQAQTQIAGQEAQSQEALQNYQLGVSKDLYAQYNDNFKPIVNKVANDAQQADSDSFQQGLVDRAVTDASQQYSSTSAGLQRDLASRGINPGSGNAIAAMAGSRDSEAMARTQAANSTRLAAKAMGWTQAQQAATIGAGLVGASSNASAASGASGMNAVGAQGSGLTGAATAAGANTTGTSGASQTLSNLGTLGNETWSTGVQRSNADNQLLYQGIGAGAGLVGAAIGGMFASDRRLKTDIRRVGTTDYGVPIYSYRYKGDTSRRLYMGVMADELEKVRPNAVIKGAIGGYDAVDYAQV